MAGVGSREADIRASKPIIVGDFGPGGDSSSPDPLEDHSGGCKNLGPSIGLQKVDYDGPSWKGQTKGDGEAQGSFIRSSDIERGDVG